MTSYHHAAIIHNPTLAVSRASCSIHGSTGWPQVSEYSLSEMYIHGGFQAAALWANYLSFKHVNNGNLKNMSVY
jgi:hypothetical protein